MPCRRQAAPPLSLFEDAGPDGAAGENGAEPEPEPQPEPEPEPEPEPNDEESASLPGRRRHQYRSPLEAFRTLAGSLDAAQKRVLACSLAHLRAMAVVRRHNIDSLARH